MRAARRRRRLGDVAWGDLAYRVYTTALAGLVLTVFASGLVGDVALDPAGVSEVATRGPAWAGLSAALALVIGVRSGRRSGPLAFERADVHHLLLGPADRNRVLRGPAISMLGYAVAASLAVGGLVGELFAQRLPGSSAAWLLSGAAFASMTTVAALGAAMLTASRRLPAAVPVVVVALLGGWSLADVLQWGPRAPLSIAGGLMFWPVEGDPAALVGPVAAVVLAALGVAVVGGLSIEAACRRTQLVGQLRFAVTQQDLRSVMLLRRQLAAEHPRSRARIRRLPSAVGRFAPVATRDLQSVLRWPTIRVLRVVVLVLAAAAALRGVAAGTTPLILVAGVLSYVAALDSIEPLAQDVDHPTLLRSYPIPAGVVLMHHLIVPALVMLVPALLAVLGFWVLGPSTVLWQVGIVVAVSGALSAVCGAAVSVVSEVLVDTGSAVMATPEVAGPRVVIRTLWPPALATIGLLPVLVAQRALRSGADPLGPASFVALGSILLCAVVVLWVRFREDMHRSMAMAIRGEG